MANGARFHSTNLHLDLINDIRRKKASAFYILQLASYPAIVQRQVPPVSYRKAPHWRVYLDIGRMGLLATSGRNRV